MKIEFDGKRALVTGAGKGIGRAIAVRLAGCGAHVVALSRTAADLHTLHEEIGCETVVVDLAYVFPDHGYERMSDQFLLGDDILVAPVVARGATRRRVLFPQGTWRGDDGGAVVGPCAQEIAAPLSRLPWFRRIEGSRGKARASHLPKDEG